MLPFRTISVSVLKTVLNPIRCSLKEKTLLNTYPLLEPQTPIPGTVTRNQFLESKLATSFQNRYLEPDLGTKTRNSFLNLLPEIANQNNPFFILLKKGDEYLNKTWFLQKLAEGPARSALTCNSKLVSP